MDEQPEEILFTDFSRGYDVRQWPPNVVRERVPVGKMLHHEHLKVEQDGTLRWHRNQFMIDGPVIDHVEKTPEVLFEFVNEGYNQLLCIDNQGDLYAMDTDWISEVPSQWTYGYELFDGGTWNLKNSSGQTRPWGLAMSRSVLFIGHKNLPIKRWDGVNLTAIGLLPPPNNIGENQDLTTWTEDDTGGHLTVIADRVTAATMPRTADSCVYYDYTLPKITDFEHRFDIRVTAAVDGGRMLIWAITDTAPAGEALLQDGLNMFVQRVGADYQIGFASFEAGVHADWWVENITVNTTYYVTVRRRGNRLEAIVYTDSDRTVILRTLTNYWSNTGRQYVYAMAGTEEVGAATIDGYVENFVICEAKLAAGQLPKGTYTYNYTYGNDEYEGMPSPPLDVVVDADDKRITLEGIGLGGSSVTWRKLYRAYTSSVKPGDRGTAYQYMATLDDNTTTGYEDNAPQSYLGDEIPFDYARPPRGDLLAFFKERMFLAGASRTSGSYYGDIETEKLQNILFYSELGYPDYWPRTNWIEIGDSAPIVGLAVFGDQLLVFKTNMVYSVTMYGTGFSVRQLDTQLGSTDPCSVASSPQGVVWTSPHGLAFYDGQSLKLLLEATEDWAMDIPEGEIPYLAYHQGYVYFQAEHLLRWDSLRDIWEMYPHAQNETLIGIRAFNHGKYQSHILTMQRWHKLGSARITVLDPVEAFANGDAEGTSYCSKYACISITLPPIIAKPGEEIWIQEIWIDGSWTNAGEPIDDLALYVNSDASYSSGDLETAPQDSRGVFLNPVGHIGRKFYIQLHGEYAKDFELRAVRVVVSRRQRRVAEYLV